MKKAGTIKLRREGKKISLTISSKDLITGLEMKPGFGIRSVHFGTKLRGYDIKKGQGYGWDGRDYIRAIKKADQWQMIIPVRDNDPKNRSRRFVKGNVYIRTSHNEIIYFDLRKWKPNPKGAIKSDGHGGYILEMEIEEIHQSN